MAFKKYVKKVARKVGRRIRKRYTKNGKANISRIVKDVSYLKSVLNPEKKRYTLTALGQILGQVFYNASGYYIADITPTPAQGITNATRNGSSIKLHSSFMQMQFYGQSATTASCRIACYIIEVKGSPDGSFGASSMFNYNNFVGGGATVYDYNSSLNPDLFGEYKILAKKTFKYAPDQFSGQQVVMTKKIGMRYKNHHVRWNGNGSTLSGGQIIMILMADTGNSSTANASTLTNIAQTAVSTGLIFNYDMVHYFYDN